MSRDGGADPRSVPRWRRRTRRLLGVVYAAAGVLHLSLPASFLRIVPSWVPWPATTIALTGLAELAGAAGLLQTRSPALRRAAGAGLALYALCVWPANVNHMIMDLTTPEEGLGWWYHGPRMLLQPVLIWAGLWTGELVDWPFGDRNGKSA